MTFLDRHNYQDAERRGYAQLPHRKEISGTLAPPEIKPTTALRIDVRLGQR